MNVLFLLSCWIVSVLASCELHATIFREFRKEGFHLQTSYKIEIVVTSSVGCPVWNTCTLALGETLSGSFFVKASELSHDGVTGCSKDVFNVEATALSSQPVNIYLYLPLQFSLNLIQSEVSLPFHLRYHSPVHKGGFVTAQVGQPQLLLLCKRADILHSGVINAPCPICSTTNCSWLELPFKTNAAKFSVDVPVGDLNDLLLVTTVTHAIAIGGCIYLCLLLNNAVVISPPTS